MKLNPIQIFLGVYVFHSLSLIPLLMATSQQCEPAEQSESGKALKGHIFKTKLVQNPCDCLVFCYSELTCQSYNYVKTDKLCELNNRTKEARPEDFVQDETRFYVRRWKNRGMNLIKQSLHYIIKDKHKKKKPISSCKTSISFQFSDYRY